MSDAVLIDSEGKPIDLNKSPFVVGRGIDADLILPFIDVSRLHAQILHGRDNYQIQDTNSVNGTFVNENRVTGNPTDLVNGDVISFAENYEYVFYDSKANVPTVPILSKRAKLQTIVDVDSNSGQVYVSGKAVSPPLSPNSFRLLQVLSRDPGRLFSYEEIHRHIWPDMAYFGETDRDRCQGVKKQLMKRMRDYIPEDMVLIEAVAKRGMRLVN